MVRPELVLALRDPSAISRRFTVEEYFEAACAGRVLVESWDMYEVARRQAQ